jgi:hypothetical protein
VCKKNLVDHEDLPYWAPKNWYNVDFYCRKKNRERVYALWDELKEKNPIVFFLCIEKATEFWLVLKKSLNSMHRVKVICKKTIKVNEVIKYEQDDDYDS